jgi:hypothetical protein
MYENESGKKRERNRLMCAIYPYYQSSVFSYTCNGMMIGQIMQGFHAADNVSIKVQTKANSDHILGQILVRLRFQ